MNIGKKIKDLRNSKLMTQSELAGTEITRNMLSQIENGVALPSLGTVLYLSQKLGVPAGYLLSEGDEEFTYIKTNLMKNIRHAYSHGQFELCRDICLNSFEDYDDELELILTDCCLGIAEESIKGGRLHQACQILDEAILHSKKTVYSTRHQQNSILIMFALLGEISPTLYSNETDETVGGDLLHPSVYDGIFCKYITVLLDMSKYEAFIEGLEKSYSDAIPEEEKLFVMHLRAKSHISRGEYGSALALLNELINSEAAPQRLLLYFACADMEICCRETEDFKGAYEFSRHKLELFEHLMAENDQ